MTLKDITYTEPFGTKFIFVEDLKGFFSKRKFKKWEEKSIGSTGILVQGMLGVYPYDVEKFIRLDKLGK